MRHLTRAERAWIARRICPNRQPFPPALPTAVEGHPVGGRTVTRDLMGSGR